MRRKKPNKTLRRALLAALLCAACLINAAPAFAACGAETSCIVRYKDGAAREEDDGLPFDVVSEAEALRLDRAGLLEWYEPDGELELLEETASPYYAEDKWDLALIRADEAFKRGYLGGGVRVGVVDSGVNPHKDLADRLLVGRNYEQEEATDDTADHYGHGTLVAGLIAGSGENGFLGVAPKAEIVPLKVTDGKAVTVSAVCRAIYGAVNDFDCRILNLSLGMTAEYKTLEEAVAYAEEQGVLVVSAVGNNGNSGLFYPAAYDTVVGVGAVGEDGKVYGHSNHNESVFLTAPGAGVKTAGSHGGYVTGSGTSFAVPHVTAAAAVLLGIDDTLTPADIRQLLSETAADLGATGWDEYYGYGLLDLSACVVALAGEIEEFDMPCAFLPDSTLRNYTDADIDLTYLLTEYDENGKCLSVELMLLTVPAKDSVTLPPPDENAFYAQYAWDTATMTPLAKARESLST
ncbi:MAG: S8 family serine peptidase [Oscillibacter sp.]|nr:S8 family serine peptidase [Oscillibacter sp.]